MKPAESTAFLKVFCVEDSMPIQMRLRQIIEEIPGAVLVGEAVSEAEAVRGILATLPDAVVLDLNLNPGSGMGVLWQIKQTQRQIKVLVLTSLGDLQHRKKCLHLGADYFFDKSKQLGALAATLAELSSPRSPTGATPSL